MVSSDPIRMRPGAAFQAGHTLRVLSSNPAPPRVPSATRITCRNHDSGAF
jgi:hypothetical protein